MSDGRIICCAFFFAYVLALTFSALCELKIRRIARGTREMRP